ncbi:hypothetical protein [Streptomyces sp. NPDC001020]
MSPTLTLVGGRDHVCAAADRTPGLVPAAKDTGRGLGLVSAYE